MQMYSSTLSLTSALDSGEWLTPRADRFTPGNDAVPIVQEAGWVPGLVRTGAENIPFTGIRSPCRPARRQSLYWQSHPGPHYYHYYYYHHHHHHHHHHHWVAVGVVVVFPNVCGNNVRGIYEYWKWQLLYLNLKYYLHCVLHTILQILYSLMMARLNHKTYSPFFSITNIRFARRILTGFYYYYYWV